MRCHNSKIVCKCILSPKLSLDYAGSSRVQTKPPYLRNFIRSFFKAFFFDFRVFTPTWRPLWIRWEGYQNFKQAIYLPAIVQLQIKDIESEMAKTQKNKNTSFHLGTRTPIRPYVFADEMHLWQLTGQLKAKLAKLKRELLTPTSGGGGGGGESQFPSANCRIR